MFMKNSFTAKVRRVGTSLGVLIPKETIEFEKVNVGEEVQISIMKPEKKLKEVLKLFGEAKATAPFVREHADREF